MKTRTLFGVVVTAVALGGCATVSSPYTYQGAAVGGALGAAAGALIDGNNRWRGALIGGALGSAMGGATAEVASRAARQSAAGNRPIYYPPHDRRDYRNDPYGHW